MTTLTPQERATALRKAADIVEQPGRYSFHEIAVADSTDCGSPHCMLGWTALFVGVWRLAGVAPKLGFNDSTDFYLAVRDALKRTGAKNPYTYQDDPAKAALGMRLLADEMDPPQLSPDWTAMAERLAAMPRIPEEA